MKEFPEMGAKVIYYATLNKQALGPHPIFKYSYTIARVRTPVIFPVTGVFIRDVTLPEVLLEDGTIGSKRVLTVKEKKHKKAVYVALEDCELA